VSDTKSNGDSGMSNFGRKAAIAAVAFAAVGSPVFGGTALAVDKKDGHDKKHVEATNTGGAVGPGGNPTYYCTFGGVVQTSTRNVAGGYPGVLLTCTVTDNGGDGGAVAVY
jgi:hypothetical protein